MFNSPKCVKTILGRVLSCQPATATWNVASRSTQFAKVDPIVYRHSGALVANFRKNFQFPPQPAFALSSPMLTRWPRHARRINEHENELRSTFWTSDIRKAHGPKEKKSTRQKYKKNQRESTTAKAQNIGEKLRNSLGKKIFSTRETQNTRGKNLHTLDAIRVSKIFREFFFLLSKANFSMKGTRDRRTARHNRSSKFPSMKGAITDHRRQTLSSPSSVVTVAQPHRLPSPLDLC